MSFGIIILWVACLLCIAIMKKIEPESKLYPLWALFVSIIVTVFELC